VATQTKRRKHVLPKRTYHTTGSLRGKFKARVRTRKTSSIWSRQGVQRTFSSGGVESSSDCVWIGHASLPDEPTFKVAILAILRRMLKLAGFTITSDQSQIGYSGTYQKGRWIYEYLPFPEAALSQAIVNWTAIDSVSDLANDIYSSFQTNLTNINAILTTAWFEMWDDNVGNAANAHAGFVDFRLMKIHLKSYSRLTVQNRTVASTAVGNDESNRNDVANNPLTGKIYKGRGTGLNIIFHDDTAAQESLASKPATGIIEMDTSQMSAAQLALYRRPVPGRGIRNCMKEGGVFLNPGNIKGSVLITKTSMNFVNFMNKMAKRFVSGATSPVFIPIGHCEVLALQRRCDTRADEPSISVGYELEQDISCYVTTGAPTYTPTHIVN
jgi:hypothetical protein